MWCSLHGHLTRPVRAFVHGGVVACLTTRRRLQRALHKNPEHGMSARPPESMFRGNRRDLGLVGSKRGAPPYRT